MEKNVLEIYLPSLEQLGEIINADWKEFRKKYDFKSLKGLVGEKNFNKTLFVAGFSLGYSNAVEAIKDQIMADELINKQLNKNDN